MAASIYRFKNSGEPLGMLKYEDAVHEEDLDGADKLVVTSEPALAKRDRLLWQDTSGTWHEHMVDTTVKTHADKRPRCESTCSNSISELYGAIASGTKIKGTVQHIMNALLSGTRWTAGNCSDFGTVQIEVWHKNVRECIAELCELTGGELETTITVGSFKVSGRSARIVKARGSNRAVRQFAYSRNVAGIKREVAADEVYTAIIGYGAKIAETTLQAQYDEMNSVDTSGMSSEEREAHNEKLAELREQIRRVRENDYAERLSVTVTSSASLSDWGTPKGNDFSHNYTTYTDNACTDATFLTKQCNAILKTMSKPLVRYEFDVSQTDDDLWRDVRLGNRVLCLDETFHPTLELDERVSYVRRRLAGRMQCRIAIGKRSNYIVKQFKAAEKTSKKTTGNHSGTNADSPVVTGGNYSGDGGNPGYEPPSVDTMPAAIKVTTPPTKLEYHINETINYDGIVCTLYDEFGAIYQDDWYINGIVPFNELIFPVQTITAGDGIVAYLATSDLQTSVEQPIRAYSGAFAQTSIRSGGRTIITTYELTALNDARIVVVENGNHGGLDGVEYFRFIFVSKSEGVVGNLRTVRKIDGETSTDTVREFSINLSDPSTRSYSYLHEGKTVYYGAGNGIIDHAHIDNAVPRQDESYLQNITNNDAWTIIYGDITSYSNDAIPVQWTRSDGAILQDTFEVTLIHVDDEHPTWGESTGDGGTSSGGGDF